VHNLPCSNFWLCFQPIAVFLLPGWVAVPQVEEVGGERVTSAYLVPEGERDPLFRFEDVFTGSMVASLPSRPRYVNLARVFKHANESDVDHKPKSQLCDLGKDHKGKKNAPAAAFHGLSPLGMRNVHGDLVARGGDPCA
jgi:hypothetical protein